MEYFNTNDEFINDVISVMSKYNNDMCTQEFTLNLITIAVVKAFQAAPNQKEALRFIKDVILKIADEYNELI